MTTAAIEVAPGVEPAERRPPPTPAAHPLSFWIKTVFGVAFTVVAVVYIGFDEVGPMVLKIVIALAISAGVFVGANKLFDLSYDRWVLFATISAFTIGFVMMLLLDGNRLLRDLSPRPWAWALIGGIAVAAVLFAVTSIRREDARLPIAAVGFAGLGMLGALAIDESLYPTLDWAKLFGCTAIGAGLGAAVRLAGGRRRLSLQRVARAALLGGAFGWLVGAWGGAEQLSPEGTLAAAMIATVIPLTAIGVRIGLTAVPVAAERREIETRSRSWIFITPALLFVIGGLLAPLLRTIFISFKSRNSSEFVGLDNYEAMIDDPTFFNVSRWENIFTSKLFWVGIGVVAVGALIGIIGGRTTKRVFESGPSSLLPVAAGFFLAACAVLATLRGTLFNNIWWVIVVTALATAIGLAVAVLADRARAENIAKSLIFLPMAISFVGASVIWRFMYQARNVNDAQTGVLNAIWVALGELSSSSWRWLAVAMLGMILASVGWLAWDGVRHGYNTRAGFAIGTGLVLAYLAYRLVGPGLGGFRTTASGEVVPETIEFLNETPYNNMWLMVILIWIQTGFTMVIFSAAIKAVPTELTEAAVIDGATQSQVFWRVTLPQIMPTVGVVVTTLIVLVMKVFDIVKVTTNGQFGTQVIANQMFDAISINLNFGLGAALATVMFLAVLPVMYLNIRRMQRA